MHNLTPAARIGEYLSCLPADIDWALAVQADERASGNLKHLGEILVEREKVTSEELKAALNAQCTDRLRQCPFLESLPAADIGRISAIAEEVQLAEEEDLMQEGQRGDSMYVVASGEMMIYQRQGDSERTTLGVAQPGEVLGEMGYFSDGTRSYSACACRPTLLLRLRYDLLREAIQDSPSLAVEFLNLVTERMRADNVHCSDSLPS